MNNYTNNKPQDPHSFKEQVKIKYQATKAIAGKFPNGTTALMELLCNAHPVALDLAGYCALPETNQLLWELKANALNQSMLYLMTLKNENTKKDLRLAYSQGNNTAYPTDIKSMARYRSTQYPNNKAIYQRGGKKGDKKKEMTQNLKTRIVKWVALLVHTLKILQQMKIPPLLARELA